VGATGVNGTVGATGPSGSSGSPATITSTYNQVASATLLNVSAPVTVASVSVTTTTAGQQVKIDSMSQIDIVSGMTAGTVSYNISYQIFRDGTALFAVTDQMTVDQASGPRTFSTIPNETWVDQSAPAGPHTYDIRIMVSGTNITAASAMTRALNAMVFG
jgi:hypothetical protein